MIDNLRLGTLCIKTSGTPKPVLDEPITLVNVMVTPPIDPSTNLFNNLNSHSTVKANQELGSSNEL